jgi:hypothetical protein
MVLPSRNIEPDCTGGRFKGILISLAGIVFAGLSLSTDKSLFRRFADQWT